MNHETTGIVRGRTIELAENIGIPDGCPVIVTVRPTSPVAGDKPWGEGIRRSAGIAADIDGFDEVFSEISASARADHLRSASSVTVSLSFGPPSICGASWPHWTDELPGTMPRF